MFEELVLLSISLGFNVVTLALLVVLFFRLDCLEHNVFGVRVYLHQKFGPATEAERNIHGY